MNQQEGAVQNNSDELEQYRGTFRVEDLSMAHLSLDLLRDEPSSHSSHLFQGDIGVSPNKNSNIHHLSNEQSDGGDLRLSMPAPKRTLPPSIVDSLNEDSLFFSGGQQNMFGSGLGSSYMHSDPMMASHSQGGMYGQGEYGQGADTDSDFDERGPRTFSLGKDMYPITAPHSSDFMYRSASTPVSASFASSSSHMGRDMLQFQQNNHNPNSRNSIPNHSSNLFSHQKQGHEMSNHNSVVHQLEQESPYSRVAAQQQQQQQQYLQHIPPNDLHIHLADIDRRMEIRRGKSAGPGSAPYDIGPMIAMPGARQLQKQQGQHQQQQLAFLNGRNGNHNPPPFRAQTQMDAMMMQQLQQRPASTPLPMSLPPHHMHQQPAPQDHSHKSHGPPLLNLCGLEDSSVEDIVAKSCRDILIEAASHSLKAVELANTLRAHVGTEVLAHIRERWGGLLSLLERHAHVFRVERIPKNDLVTLVSGGGPSPHVPGVSGVQAAGLQRVSGGRASSSPAFPIQHMQGGSDIPMGMGSFYNNTGPSIHSASASPSLPPNQGPVRTLSPPTSYPHYGTGSSSSGDYMMMGGGVGSGEGTVSRCLHVGNVPANMTETQLLRELERYGDVDCLKLVSQRSRRFAFVSFRTVEQAISAKQRMTRVHPWKSAISFAHKESQSMTMSQPQSTGSPAPYNFDQQQQQIQQQYYTNANPTSPPHANVSSQSLMGNPNYQQQQGALHGSGSMSHAMSVLQHQKQQQDEEEELNQLFTRSLSVPPLAPAAYQRYNMDSVFGTGSAAALDIMGGNSSFAPGAGIGLIRPASTGSVNLDRDSYLCNAPIPSSYSFCNNAGMVPMAMPRPREMLSPHYGGFDFDSNIAPGGVASMGRGMIGSPGAGAVRSVPAGLHSPRPLVEEIGLDLDYDYDLLLSGNPPLSAAERGAPLSLSDSPGSMQAGTSSAGEGQDFVLRRLCDDTYVPTQPWPVRWEVDAFYCSAVVAQLQQFGGVTTISKLRGFLRSRVNAVDNIKSVPLKAMLSGYPSFFTVRSNQVTLAPDPLFVGTGGMEAGLTMNSMGMVNLAGSGMGIGSFPPGSGGAGLGAGRGHVRSSSTGADFDLRSASHLSPGTSPPSPTFGYGLQ